MITIGCHDVSCLLSNLILLVIFTKLYWQVDQDSQGQKHFGFEPVQGAYFLSAVTQGSCLRPQRAKILAVCSCFFVMLHVVLKILSKK